ncbi:MAG: GNAT family protein [Candidatus Paceibacterota bacterium]|jgi:RimJ/RimL family protein N-acetyltransferase
MKKPTQKQNIIIRLPRISDLDSSLEMINSLVEEKAMLTVQKKSTHKEEEKYLKRILKEKEAIHLFLIIDGKVAGSAKVSRLGNGRNHIGELGISLRYEYRGMGLGKKLSKAVMEKAIKKFKLKIIILNVFKKNKPAYYLYKELGFKKVGMIKGEVKYYNRYEDVITMVKYI